jgi:hypothetical protein
MRISFMGFEARTTALQAAGWRLAVVNNLARMTAQIELYHPDLDLLMVTHEIDHRVLFDFTMTFPHRRYDYDEATPVFAIQQVISKGDKVHRGFFGSLDAVPFNAVPDRISTDVLPWEDITSVFRPIDVPEEKEIIVGPQSVDEALALILQMQAQDQAELREKNRNRARQVHAQIVSLAA